MSKWTRRAFITSGIVAGGGVVVGIAMRPGNQVKDLAAKLGDDGANLVHTYVKIDSDNTITAIIPHSEMGQGVHTALGQMLAEELDADWDQLKLEEAPAIGEYAMYAAGRRYLLTGIDFPKLVIPTVDGMMMRVADTLNMQITGGSMSVRTTGILAMRTAGAATRQLLQQAAAEAWDVPVEEIATEKSHLIHAASNRREPYASFAADVAEMTPSYTPSFKDPADYKIVGTHKPRRDIPAKVDGSLKFAMDVQLPNMLYATVVRSPVPGGSVVELDDSVARSVEGVVDVIVIPATTVSSMLGDTVSAETVAVVADSYWSASKGLKELKVQWSEVGFETVSSDGIFEQFNRDISASAERQTDHVQGEASSVFAGAAKVVDADYHVPFLAHTCMEPLNATADVRTDSAEIWVGCQNPLGFRRDIADSLGMDPEKVTLHNHSMGGGFGRKARPDWALQVAHLAREVGRPVQLIWSREEDVRQDFYRPAVQSRFRAAFDAQDNLLAWENTYTNKNEPIEAPLIPYAIPAQDIGYVSSPVHIPFGAWRSVDHSQHGFFTESFIDEVANAAGKDSFEFRAELLKDSPRHLAVLNKAAEEAQWSRPLPEGSGRGISLQESFGSLVAQVVEVAVVEGEVSVERVVAVIDPGLAVAPDGIAAQLESGIIYGLTAALHGEITIEKGAVVQSNFHDYKAVRMNEAPNIETHVINSGHDIGGAGEPGTPGIAPALMNAVFNATGTRVRQLPLSRFDLNYQVEETGAVG
ncbi:MAG: xanthine dehydrogenase family protein molybdopterin-binding subunit [Pseudomonadales bacterium]|jgi:isoquinoline 1-oxidoreductase beta subunit|nr:xanthine dehydrogenase family protein molybdopterin-binding subunit [Pseudomonadales bacterium]